MIFMRLYPHPLPTCRNTPVTVDPMLCSRYDPFTPTVTFLTTSDVLNVSWIASDNTGIREFQFGIINAEDFSGDQRDIAYVSTGLQTHYSVFDPSLISMDVVWSFPWLQWTWHCIEQWSPLDLLSWIQLLPL